MPPTSQQTAQTATPPMNSTMKSSTARTIRSLQYRFVLVRLSASLRRSAAKLDTTAPRPLRVRSASLGSAAVLMAEYAVLRILEFTLLLLPFLPFPPAGLLRGLLGSFLLEALPDLPGLHLAPCLLAL